MIVDTSAIVAILKGEDDASTYLTRLARNHGRLRMSAASFLETSIVIDRATENPASKLLDEILSNEAIAIVSFTAEQAVIARAAYRNYGKGSGHPAKLNFGDCFAYALAKETGEPLLFKGDDFTHTDVVSALA